MTSYNKSKQETRKGLYKAKDTKGSLQKRQEQKETIRKQQREQLFQKRRLDNTEVDQAVTFGSNLSERQSLLYSYLNLINSNDPNQVLDGTTKIRKILSLEHNPPIQEVIDSGVIPRLVEFLTYSHIPQLQFESCWALTNIASGSSDQTHYVIRVGAVPAFKQLLSSPNDDVRDQACWALGNIAGDSSQCRDHILEHGVMECLLKNLVESPKISMLRNGIWTLSNLCRGKPQPDWKWVSPCLPILARLVNSCDDEVLTDTLWALSYLSDGPNERIQAIVETGISRRLNELLIYNSFAVQTPALRLVGNIVTGDDTQTQMMINCGVLHSLLALMSSTRKTIKKEACWTVSNITAGNKVQVQAVIDARIIPKLIDNLKHGDYEIKKETAWAISNATSCGSSQQLKFLVDSGAIEPMSDLLSCTDTRIIMVALEAIENILKVGEVFAKNTGHNLYADMVEECGGLDKIENLQNHQNQEIYDKSVVILETYFSAEEEDENISPNIITGGFSFGTTMNSTAFDF